jgi:hypothetical protein
LGADGIFITENRINIRAGGISMGTDGIAIRAEGIAMGAEGIAMGAEGIVIRKEGIAMRAKGIAMGSEGVALRTISRRLLQLSFLPCSLPGPCARIPAKCPQVIVFAFTWDFWFKIPSTRVGAFVCEGADPYDEVSKGVGSALCRRLRAQDP